MSNSATLMLVVPVLGRPIINILDTRGTPLKNNTSIIVSATKMEINIQTSG